MRIDPREWPEGTEPYEPDIRWVGPDCICLRLVSDHADEVVHVIPTAAPAWNPMGQEPDEGTDSRSGSSAAEQRPVSPQRVGSIPTPSANAFPSPPAAEPWVMPEER